MAQTTEELINDGQNTDNVLTQGMGYDRKSYSPLDQINKSTVTRLGPIWNASLMTNLGELAAPTANICGERLPSRVTASHPRPRRR